MLGDGSDDSTLGHGNVLTVDDGYARCTPGRSVEIDERQDGIDEQHETDQYPTPSRRLETRFRLERMRAEHGSEQEDE